MAENKQPKCLITDVDGKFFRDRVSDAASLLIGTVPQPKLSLEPSKFIDSIMTPERREWAIAIAESARANVRDRQYVRIEMNGEANERMMWVNVNYDVDKGTPIVLPWAVPVSVLPEKVITALMEYRRTILDMSNTEKKARRLITLFQKTATSPGHIMMKWPGFAPLMRAMTEEKYTRLHRFYDRIDNAKIPQNGHLLWRGWRDDLEEVQAFGARVLLVKNAKHELRRKEFRGAISYEFHVPEWDASGDDDFVQRVDELGLGLKFSRSYPSRTIYVAA